jgi:hypothetical protein
MKWVTRERPQVDRIACPWLIKRFVDPDAEFLYAPRDQVLAVAIAQGFSAVYDDDHAQLAAELPVYDALYAWCRRQEGQT